MISSLSGPCIQGLYDRAPESFEIGQFYTRLQSGELTRAQLIEEFAAGENLSKPVMS